MTIGEPRHPFPGWVADVLASGISESSPNTRPIRVRRHCSKPSIAWLLKRRFAAPAPGLAGIMPLNGTREGLFNAVDGAVPRGKDAGKRPVVLIPNPFYQCLHGRRARHRGGTGFCERHGGNRIFCPISPSLDA